MKAPETIYLATTDEVQNLDNSFIGIAHNNSDDIIEPIEYVRKDISIEKAWDWIEDNMLSSNQQDNSRLYFEQFVNHMKK